jgi:hypothetical protein
MNNNITINSIYYTEQGVTGPKGTPGPIGLNYTEYRALKRKRKINKLKIIWDLTNDLLTRKQF